MDSTSGEATPLLTSASGLSPKVLSEVSVFDSREQPIAELDFQSLTVTVDQSVSSYSSYQS